MKSVDPTVVTEPDGSLTYGAPGYGEKCDRCGNQLLPGERRSVMPGEWRPRHKTCPAPVAAPTPEEIAAELEALL